MGKRGHTSDGVDDVVSNATPDGYAQLLDILEERIVLFNTNANVVAATDSAVEFLETDRETLLGSHASALFDASDCERLEARIQSLRSSEETEPTLSVTVKPVDNTSISCELRLRTVENADGSTQVAGVIREAVSLTQTGDTEWSPEQAVPLSSVIDEADVGVFVLDASFSVAWIDEGIETYFDIDRADVIGQDKRTLIEETIADRLEDPKTFMETVFATYEPNKAPARFECHVTRGPDRQERWLEHRSKPIESGPYEGGRIELYYDITDRKRIENARVASEEQFRSLVDAVDEYAIFRLDPNGNVASWNSGATQIKGYEPREILGKHFSVFYTPDERDTHVPQENLERARRNGVVEDEGWRLRSDGSKFWANVTITAIRDADGELEGFAKVTRDMTDRREREQRLQRERDLIERILETSSVGIAVVNPDGTTSRANERMAQLLSLPVNDEPTLDPTHRQLYDETGSPISLSDRPARRVFETGEPVTDSEVCIKEPDGRQRWLSINATPLSDDAGVPEQVVTTATDITELKHLADRRKQELEEREKEYTALQLATSLLEPGTKPIDDLLNELIQTLPQAFRYPEETEARLAIGTHEATTDGYTALERSISARTQTANETAIVLTVCLTDQAAKSDNTPFLTEEQELIDTLVTLVKFHFERREYIDELQLETRRLEQFAYAASHDIQEPLRMVSSYLQLLEQRYGSELDEDGLEFLEYATDGADRMRNMIDGLLAYSRIKTHGNPLEAVDLEAVLDGVVTELEEQIEASDADLTIESLPAVEGDSHQLHQLFYNLLENAIEYSDESPVVRVSAADRGDEWIISVTDEGIGIDSELHGRIFEVFERLHSRNEYAGTGIGLAICQRIVERHRGDIWVESAVGEGSTFSVALRAADESVDRDA